MSCWQQVHRSFEKLSVWFLNNISFFQRRRRRRRRRHKTKILSLFFASKVSNQVEVPASLVEDLDEDERNDARHHEEAEVVLDRRVRVVRPRHPVQPDRVERHGREG